MHTVTLYSYFLKCTCVSTDSRNCPKGSLFFALKGNSFNGNEYAAKALEMGSAYAVVDEAAYIPDEDSRYLLVDDSLHALQRLAKYHARQLSTPLIGITGTNGKTTTKELITAVLSQSFKVLATQGNLNNHIGVPLTLLRLTAEHNYGIIEMGASHPGDIKELVEMVDPDYGLITNVGKAHLEGFGSLEGVIKTKGELYDYLRIKSKSITFLHTENSYLSRMAVGLSTYHYGSNEYNHISGHIVGNSPYLSFSWKAKAETIQHEVTTQLIGEYNLPNALAAIAIGYYLGMLPEDINRGLAQYTPQNNRSQLQTTANNTLIIDAYNANPASMMASISNFSKMEAEHKMLILGDMRELGKDSATEHQKIVDYLEECGFEQVALVGELFANTLHTYSTYADAKALIAALQESKPCGCTILIKGSNGIKLNTVVEVL